jgi:hypothetical protein
MTDMHNEDMHHAYIKSLILMIGGNRRPTENTKAYLSRVSQQTDVGYRSLRAAYYGQWISKNQFVSSDTLKKLEWAAEDAEQTYDAVAFTELQIEIWETAPALFQQHIDAAREFVARLRRYDAERRRIVLPARSDDAGVAAPPAGFAAAGAKA